MKIIARHERDDREIELEDEQAEQLEHDLALDILTLVMAGIRSFVTVDGWHYRLEKN